MIWLSVIKKVSRNVTESPVPPVSTYLIDVATALRVLNLFVNPPVYLLEGFPFSIAGGCPGLVFVVQWVDFTAQELVAALFVSVAAVRLDCGIR